MIQLSCSSNRRKVELFHSSLSVAVLRSCWEKPLKLLIGEPVELS